MEAKPNSQRSTTTGGDARTLDVAIVGGGIAGLYAYYKLQGLGGQIKLFESSDRLGGKIDTWRVDPTAKDGPKSISFSELLREDVKNLPLRDMFAAEFGPMRIEPSQQPHLDRLLRDLDIKEKDVNEAEKWSDLVPFRPYQSPKLKDPIFALEGEEAEQATPIDLLLLGLRRVFETVQIISDDGKENTERPWCLELGLGLGTVPYDEANFFWKGFRKETAASRRYWKGFFQQWIVLMEEEHYYVIRENMKFRGNYLYSMGFWNVLSVVLSHMAVAKLRDWGAFYHLLPENPNAAEWIIFWLRAVKSTNSLRGIRGGMDWMVYSLCMKVDFLPNKLEELETKITKDEKDKIKIEYTTGNGLALNRRLIAIEERDEYAVLTFERRDELGCVDNQVEW